MSHDLYSLIERYPAEWRQTLKNAGKGETYVLLCTSVGSHGPVLTHDLMIASTLISRGVRVEVLLCDGALPACEACTIYLIPQSTMLKNRLQKDHCPACFQSGLEQVRSLGITVRRYGDYLTSQDERFAQETVDGLVDDALKTFELDGVRLGEEAYAGTLRYFAVGDLLAEEQAHPMLRKYLKAAILTYLAVGRAFKQDKPDVTLFHHGIYVPQGVIGKVARQYGIRVVNYTYGYRKGTFVYSHDDTYHRTMMEETERYWRDEPLTTQEQTRLMTYLEDRRYSKQDWIKFNVEPEEDARQIRTLLNLDARPIILVLTNVTWDAQLFYKNNGFPSLQDWLLYTLHYFKERTDLQVVVRVHPGEISAVMPTRQPIKGVLDKEMPDLPENVRIVDANSDLSTYTLAEMSDSVIIYGTKAGVELAARGMHVIVAGEAWIRGKGLTIDVSSREEYREVLERLPFRTRMSDAELAVAQQYAYHYFFRRLMPMRLLRYHHERPADAQTPARKHPLDFLKGKLFKKRAPKLANKIITASPLYIGLEDLRELEPNGDPGLDALCAGILNQEDFVYLRDYVDP